MIDLTMLNDDDLIKLGMETFGWFTTKITKTKKRNFKVESVDEETFIATREELIYNITECLKNQGE